MSRTKIDRSGCLPYIIEDDEIKILFMLPSKEKYGGNKFQIAKGKHEDGETPKETCMREAGEELGLFSGNVVDTHHLGKFLGRTDFYIVEIKDKDHFGDPHFETKEVKWMTPEQFQKEGRGLHKPVVSAAVRWIRKKEGIKE